MVPSKLKVVELPEDLLRWVQETFLMFALETEHIPNLKAEDPLSIFLNRFDLLLLATLKGDREEVNRLTRELVAAADFAIENVALLRQAHTDALAKARADTNTEFEKLKVQFVEQAAQMESELAKAQEAYAEERQKTDAQNQELESLRALARRRAEGLLAEAKKFASQLEAAFHSDDREAPSVEATDRTTLEQELASRKDLLDRVMSSVSDIYEQIQPLKTRQKQLEEIGDTAGEMHEAAKELSRVTAQLRFLEAQMRKFEALREPLEADVRALGDYLHICEQYEKGVPTLRFAELPVLPELEEMAEPKDETPKPAEEALAPIQTERYARLAALAQTHGTTVKAVLAATLLEATPPTKRLGMKFRGTVSLFQNATDILKSYGWDLSIKTVEVEWIYHFYGKDVPETRANLGPKDAPWISYGGTPKTIRGCILRRTNTKLPWDLSELLTEEEIESFRHKFEESPDEKDET